MIDMHSHVLFGVDDGPETIEESVRIVQKAVEEGISNMIVTPHAFSPHYHVSKEDIEGKISLLMNVIREVSIPLTIHAGQEVRLHDKIIDALKAGEAMTLAGSKYLLLELPSHAVPAYTVPVIEQLLAEGVIPIIAHPERNRAIAEKPDRLQRLIQRGALAQVTAGSLSGHFGKHVQKLALRLVQANLIHTYGSDVHNVHSRPLLFNEGLDYLEKKKLHRYADLFLENNARIVANKHYIQLEPEKIGNNKWWKISK
ncbi:CpsB/CapC family capsule biosynthesis tyrosine phosphatase [Sporosarcina sp. FSL K6-1522]|uniref:tyrosine-protein phosphatase n=1 Tax=Sporosarcina sp. FSL K6-1522 TaxID=2921554 RepID=UPI00315A37E7